MENTVQARLKAYLSEKKISQSDFGRSIGVSAAYVGSIRRGIDPEKLRAISKAYPDLNLDWLVYGTGDMIKSSSDPATPPDTVLLLPWEAKGGLIGDFADAVQEYQCERIISPIRGADFAMQVAGDSISTNYTDYQSVAKKWHYVVTFSRKKTSRSIAPGEEKPITNHEKTVVNPSAAFDGCGSPLWSRGGVSRPDCFRRSLQEGPRGVGKGGGMQ